MHYFLMNILHVYLCRITDAFLKADRPPKTTENEPEKK